MSTGAHWWQVKDSPEHQKLTNISFLGESYQSIIRSVSFVPYLFSERDTGDMKIILKFNKLWTTTDQRVGTPLALAKVLYMALRVASFIFS